MACGIEIGGSPLALNMGTDMPGGLPYQPRPQPADPNPSWNGYSTAPQQITLDTEHIDEMCLENEKSSQKMRGK